MPKTEQFEKDVLELYTGIFMKYGLDNMSATLFTMLYLEPEEISMDDLAEKSRYSLSGVSTKLKTMENMGLITSVKKPGTKKLYYYMDKSLKDLMIGKLRRALEIEIKPTLERLPILLNKYQKEFQETKDERFKKQYKNIKNYYEEMSKFEKMMYNIIEDLGKM